MLMQLLVNALLTALAAAAASGEMSVRIADQQQLPEKMPRAVKQPPRAVLRPIRNPCHRCPCGTPNKEPFYECSLHPLISDIPADSCHSFSCSETSSRTICPKPSPCEPCKPCKPCDCSSSSSSSSSGSYLSEHCQKRCYATYDFDRSFPQISGMWKDWSYWQYNNLIADGGSLTRSRKGGYLDTSVYTVTADQSYPYWADHYKYFIYANGAIPVGESVKLTFEFKARVSTKGRGCKRFPFPKDYVNSDEDVRLASGGFRVFESQSGMNFAFHLTNDLVYAVYERNVTIAGINGFSYFIPVRPRKPKMMHSLQIIVDSTAKKITWNVDGQDVLAVDHVGLLLKSQCKNLVNQMGGAQIGTFPRVLRYGFGSFTHLDNYPACRPDCKSERNCNYPCVQAGLVRTSANPALPQYNPLLGPPNQAEYYDNFSKESSRLWGQGSETWIRSIKVFEEWCYHVRHRGCISSE